ncbi:MAG: DUF3307 domain-containing protein [Alicyclobacillus sp.]|nr:DUF3307 domain-containing protein [Alicyclobacillus sp.]
MLVPLLILAHLVSDFPLQTDRMVLYKAKKPWPWFSSALGIHTSVHFVATLLFCALYDVIHRQGLDIIRQGIRISALVALSHFLIDIGKVYVEKTPVGLGSFIDSCIREDVHAGNPPKRFAPDGRVTKLCLFFADQLLHVGAILLILWLFAPQSVRVCTGYMANMLHGHSQDLSVFQRVVALCIVGLCATSVSGVVVQILTQPSPEPTERMVSRGKLIGYLERMIVVTLVCIGAYAAIPIIVAAKSLARFKELDNKEWAEYFLVGTLSSIFCGTISGLFLKTLLNLHS